MSGRITVLCGLRIFAVSAMKLHAAEGDDVRVGRRRLARQIEAVADEIGNVLDFGLLVIMREDHGVPLLAQPVDLGTQVQAGQVFTGLGSHCRFAPWLAIRTVTTASSIPAPLKYARALRSIASRALARAIATSD
jgi:hypothetical protein